MKKFLNISLWVLLIAGLVVSVAFVGIEQNSLKCSDLLVKVDYSEENYFVDEDDIKAMIYNTGDSIEGQPMESIQVPVLEKLINNHPSVADAQVYKTINGEVKVKVKQRKPLIRIYNNQNESFYIDEDGHFMPLSTKYTARVLIANGNIKVSSAILANWNIEKIMRFDSLAAKTIIDDLFKLAKFINEDTWRKAQFQQVYVDENGEIELIPRVGNHRILIGDISDIEEKINRLMIFYKEGLSKTGWNEYQQINLKFKDQVVCTKN